MRRSFGREWFMKSSQQGAALIIVLFMFSIVAVIMSSIVQNVSGRIDSAAEYFESQQAWLLCLSGEALARELLHEDYETDPKIDSLADGWADTKTPYEIEGGYIEIQIRDLHGLLNINNIDVEKERIFPWQKRFLRLVELTADLEGGDTKKYSSELLDWIDKDELTGTEEITYLSGEGEVRPPNGSTGGVSELRLLYSMSREDYRELYHNSLPLMTAIPKGSRINPNTVEPEVLASFSSKISEAQAESTVKKIRGLKDGVPSVEEFLKLLPEKVAEEEEFSLVSEFFQVRVRAKFNDQYRFLVSVLHRNPSSGKISLISRDMGQRFLFKYSRDYSEEPRQSEYDIDI
jgi:type II secretory pathway component PulK